MSLPTWVPVDETKPAPLPLLVVQSFVNTWEADSSTDVLADPVSANQWLRDAGLVHAQNVEDANLEVVRELREAIRALLVHNGGGDAPGDAELHTLRDLAEMCRMRPAILAAGTVQLRPDEGAGIGGVAELLLIIRDAQHDGTWRRLKACRNPDCRWAYYDRSHAGRGAWCDMAVCGNRIKNRTLRSRRADAGRVASPAVDAE
jgi:predicted RNA-binding Zn ribbon-like protein